MTTHTARASSLVQLLDDVLAGRDPKGPKVSAILTALGWPYEDKMKASRAELVKKGTFPHVLEIDEACPEPTHEPGEQGPEVVVPARPTPPATRTAPARLDRATPAPARVVTPPTETKDDTPPTELAAFLAWALKHKSGTIRYEAQRILERIERVREEIAKGDAERKRLARIAELEAELRDLKSQGLHRCPDCDVSSKSGAGLAAHRRSAHPEATS